MMKTISAMMAAVALTGAAAADEAFLPRTDYEAEAVVSDTRANTRLDATLRHHRGLFRVEGSYQGQPAVFLVDAPRDTSTLLMDVSGMRIAMDVPTNDALDRVTRASSARERLGDDVVAGEACTVYRVAEGAERADVCMTGDNIVLSVDTPTEGRVFEVIRLRRGAQDASLFRVPAGYQRTRLPQSLGGLPLQRR
jgi:hypothetical protein